MTSAKTRQHSRKTKSTESDVCKAWLNWLSLVYPNAYSYLIKIDNEGTTNRANAVNLGLHVGASDYFLAWPTLEYYGAWFEVKREGWKHTKSNDEHYQKQLRFGRRMRSKGYAFYFCIGLDELMQATNEYLNVKEND